MPDTRLSEFSYINWLRKRIPSHSSVLIGPGDDTAAMRVDGSRPLLITTDMLMEGSCFLLRDAGAHAVGRKALAVNLSDIAAMAGRPTAAVVSLGLPREGGQAIAEGLFEGMREIAEQVDVPIVGGDTNSWSGELVVSVTVLGEATGSGPVRRNGARPGDAIFVTGALGGSIRGKHLDFVPRVRESQLLHAMVGLSAMIDISDGLSRDLHHLCEESGCGALLDSAAVPISDAAIELAATSGKSPLEHALGDGEDFELLFCVGAEDGERLRQHSPVPVWQIGVMTEQGVELMRDGTRHVLPIMGYEHQLAHS